MTSTLSVRQDCRVILVETVSETLQRIAELLREQFGFTQVETYTSLTEVPQSAPPGASEWMIIPLAADQAANALQLLKSSVSTPALQNRRVSLFVTPDEQFILPAAFSLGLLSYHTAPITDAGFIEELNGLFARLEKHQFNETLTAADYLRHYLQATKQYELQYQLEKNLIKTYRGNAALLINLAETQFHLGRADAAKATLLQAKLLDASETPAIDEVAINLFAEPLPNSADLSASSVNILDLKTVCIIDSDDAVRAALKDILGKLGVSNVKDFADGQAAWEDISGNPEPSLIIMEWKIPKITGPILIQRIRHHNYQMVPVIVLSSLISEDDMPLVREIGVANIVKKPLKQEDFLPKLIWTLQQDRLPTEHHTMESTIRSAIKSHKPEIYGPILERFLQDPSVAMGKKRLIQAELAYATGHYKTASDLAIESLKFAGESILVLNLLGKTLMQLHDYQAAQKCFEKAHNLSPMNLERICNIAEVKGELGDKPGADAALEQAKKVDASAAVVQEAQVRVALASGDPETAKKFMQHIEALDGVISYQNNKAVANTKAGFAREAIDIYLNTLAAIPDDQVDLVATVRYNLALAMIKAKQPEKAVDILEKASKLTTSKIIKKIKSLRARLNRSLNEGIEFTLMTSGDDNAAQSPDNSPGASESPGQGTESFNTARLALMGDICCHPLFQVALDTDPRIARLFHAKTDVHNSAQTHETNEPVDTLPAELK